MPTLLSTNFQFDRVEIATFIAALHHWHDSGRRPESLSILLVASARTTRSMRPALSN